MDLNLEVTRVTEYTAHNTIQKIQINLAATSQHYTSQKPTEEEAIQELIDALELHLYLNS